MTIGQRRMIIGSLVSRGLQLMSQQIVLLLYQLDKRCRSVVQEIILAHDLLLTLVLIDDRVHRGHHSDERRAV